MSGTDKTENKEQEKPKEDKKPSINEQLESMARRLDEIPDIMTQVFAQYDKTVNQRFETILKSGKTSGGGEGGNFFKDLITLANKLTSGEPQPSGTKEHSELANRIVTLSLRKTLKDVEKAVGAIDHVVLSNH